MRLLASVLVLVAAASPALAADPQPYKVEFHGTGHGDIDTAMKQSSLLASLRSRAPVSPYALIDRAQGDIGRVQTVLQSFGYYASKVTVTIDGFDVHDPNLPDKLEKVPQGQTVDVMVNVERGPLYRLQNIDIEGQVPDGAQQALGLKPGQPAVAQDVLNAQAALLSWLQERGYAFAKVDIASAYADDKPHVIDVTYKADTGPKVDIGTVTFKGLKDLQESFARDTLTVHPGELYKPSAVEASRKALLGIGVFSSVTARAAPKPDKNGRVPITFEVHERPLHSVTITGNYSTDLGTSLAVTWSHRNLFGGAQQLHLSAAVTGVGGSATSGVGYDFAVGYVTPHFFNRHQELELDASALKQHLIAYNQKAETLGAQVRRNFSDLWKGRAGVTLTHDEVTQEGSTRLYQLIALPVVADYDSTKLAELLADPTHGLRLKLQVTPTYAFGATNAGFVVMQATASTYFNLSGNGRSVLATRALLGSIQGATSADLPPDQRFYLGGGGTVRGFRYQSIGPHFADGTPQGATSVDAASVEFRQRFLSNYGAAAFVDIGQAASSGVPFSGSLQIGAGIGARYYTPIGVVRVDFAVPLTHVPDNSSFEIYIGLGQSF